MAVQVTFHKHLLYPAVNGPETNCLLCAAPLESHKARYQCEQCSPSAASFCQVCVLNLPLAHVTIAPYHPHPLALCVVPNDEWLCSGTNLEDGCQQSSSSSSSSKETTTTTTARLTSSSEAVYLNSQTNEERFRCAECDLDFCYSCVVHYSKSIQTSIHAHPLIPYDCNNGWCCDASLIVPGGCRRGVTHFFQTAGIERYRCCRCDFDLCSLCCFANKIETSNNNITQQEQTTIAAAATTTTTSTNINSSAELLETNEELVKSLVNANCIRSEAVKNAFLRVDRGLFLPQGTESTKIYSGSPCEISKPVHFHMKSASLIAECLMELSGNLSKDASCLVIPPGSGYMNSLLAVLAPQGVSCGIAMTESQIDFARKCTEKFMYEQKEPIADIEYITGNCFLLDKQSTSFDRIHVDVNVATSEMVQPLTDYLRIGGRMTVSVHEQMFVYERPKADSIFKRPMKISFPGKCGSLIPPISLSDENCPQPLFQFASPKVLMRNGEIVSVKPHYTYLPDQSHSQQCQQSPQKSPQVASTTGTPQQRQHSPPKKRDTLEYFLQSIGLSSYLPNFLKEEISYSMIHLLTDEDLQKMSIPLGPRKLIIEKLKERTSRSSASQMLSKRAEMTLKAIPIRPIGGGSFGTVWKGIWNSSTPVAMKVLNNVSATSDFQSEIQILSSLRHPNVCISYGVARFQGMLYLVEELANGSVLSLLQENDHSVLTNDILIEMALSCAAGMSYLCDMSIIHRDLAARNLLYFCVGTGRYTIKVADFGLARVVNSSEYIAERKTACPVKWTAIEALEMRLFTTMSDVWSFGIVLYELFSHGKEPYADLTAKEVLPFLETEQRLSKPEECPDEVYEIMQKCWLREPTKRPSWLTLIRQFKRMSYCNPQDEDDDECISTTTERQTDVLKPSNSMNRRYFSLDGVECPEMVCSVSPNICEGSGETGGIGSSNGSSNTKNDDSS